MPIIMMINLKGGVGKTVNSVAIAECFASQGHKTLLIDADHQCLSSEMLLGEQRCLLAERDRRTFYDLLTSLFDPQVEKPNFERYIHERASNIGGGLEDLSVMPCSIRLEAIQTNMAKARKGYPTSEEFRKAWNRWRRRVKSWLLYNYEYVFVDCPPSFMPHIAFFMGFADTFIVPCIPDRLSVRGTLYLMERLRYYNFKIPGLGTLWSMFRNIQTHTDTILRATRGVRPYDEIPKPFETVIPNAVQISRATDPTLEFSRFSQKYAGGFYQSFRNVSHEIIERLHDR